MSTESHLAQLQRRHEALEQKIVEATHHPSLDSIEITELKRRKLQLKDEIVRLSARETVH